ncbi:MAG TPA: PQQ-binding-like beta-propeller repeat protein, partial [Ktedonobacteraceae bacterium]|nr:PQQ-binding-like beta-propeller repeat protein [Ktedonobacteraceae bacterium]
TDNQIDSTLVSNSVLYMGTDYGAAAFDLTKQALIWYQPASASTAFQFRNILLQSGMLYLQPTMPDNTLYVFNTQDGKQIWAYDPLNINKQDFSDPFHISLTSDAHIYAHNSSVVRALNPLTGAVIWETNYLHWTNNDAIKQMVVSNNGIFFITGPGGGDILALNQQDGSKLWYMPSTDVYSSLAVGQNHVYALGAQTLYALNIHTGTLLWQKSNISNNMQTSTTQNDLYLVDTNPYNADTTSNAINLDPGTGKTLWSIQNINVISSTLP